MKKQRFTPRKAIALHLGEDGGEMEAHRRYQPTRTPCPVYTVGNDYLAASGSTRPPRGSPDYSWVSVESWVTKQFGWTIWKHEENDNG